MTFGGRVPCYWTQVLINALIVQVDSKFPVTSHTGT
jgi:hypothetical protein